MTCHWIFVFRSFLPSQYAEDILEDSVLCLVTSSRLTLCDPMDCTSPGSSVHGDSAGKNTGVGCYALLQDLANPGIEPRFPAFHVDSLPSEPPVL